jgi:hypothetical protein
VQIQPIEGQDRDNLPNSRNELLEKPPGYPDHHKQARMGKELLGQVCHQVLPVSPYQHSRSLIRINQK